jgi:hypothetical protein
MRRLIKTRPSPALTVAFIALFVALGGSATALKGKNGVKANDLAKNSVGKRAIIKNGVGSSETAPKSVGTSEVIDNSLTGNDILESSLGTVPSATSATTATNANSLGGKPASDYATKTGNEGVRLVGTSGQPAFLTGWANSGTGPPSSFQSVGFWKDQFGIVHLQGDATRTSGTNTDIFALPAGYRPSAYENISVYGNNGTAAGIAVVPTSDPTPGAVRLVGGDPAFIGLSSVSFKAGG